MDSEAADGFLPSLSESLRLRASIFLRLDLAAPWGFALSKSADMRLHVVQAGVCFLGGGGLESPIELHGGEIVLLRRGHQHWIADRPGRVLMSSDDAVDACRLNRPPFQEGALSHRLICGHASVRDRGGGWLISLLPEAIHFRRGDLDDDRVWSIVNALDARSSSLESDDAAVLDRLTEALFLCLLQRAAQLDLEIGRLGAARRDPRVRRAIVLMHSRLEEPWTLERLAGEAGISRAALARHFKGALGVPVMDYLQRLRIARAKELLLDGAGLGEVAAQTGYSSGETFRKAFKRQEGRTPAAYVRAAGSET